MNNGLDIIDFIHQNTYFFNYKNNIKRMILWYSLVIKFLKLEKVNTFKIYFFVVQCILASQFLAPKKWWPKFLKIKRQKVNAECSKKFLDHVFKNYTDQTVLLFDKKIFYLSENIQSWAEKFYSFYILIYLLKEVIIDDQYHVKELIKDGDIVIDAGVLIADFSIWANHLYPNAHIYGFEPSPKTFNLAVNNANIRSENIHILNKALGTTTGQTTLSVGSDIGLWGGDAITDNKFVEERLEHFDKKIPIDIITIDQFVKEHNLTRVDFIKIDTEGFEKEIITGAKETIQKYSPIIACAAYHLKNDLINIPKLVLDINGEYTYTLSRGGEMDFVFIPKNKS